MNQTEKKTIISLNGVDEIGKSTQLRFLNRHLHDSYLAPGLNSFHDQLTEEASDFDWWFHNPNYEEFLGLIFDSISRRNKHIELRSESLVLVDRGFQMFVAVAIATLQIKLNITFTDAKKIVDEFLEHLHPSLNNNEDLSILLQKSSSISVNVNHTLNNSNFACEQQASTYRRYQENLNEALSYYEENDLFAQLVVYDKPIVDVQNDIRSLIRGINIPVNYIGHTINQIVGIGGMSESGKSTLGSTLRREHGFTRLKQHYFIRSLWEKYPNHEELSPEQMALFLLEEIARFSDQHYYLNNFSIESLRSLDLTVEFKKLLGAKFNIAFTKCGRDLAISRSQLEHDMPQAEATKLVNDKDSTKAKAGAHMIESISDRVFMNDDSIESFREDIMSYVTNLSESKYSFRNVEDLNIPLPYQKILKQVREHLLNNLDDICLIILTGSAGREQIIDGISDIDILVVCEGKMSLEEKLLHRDKLRFLFSDELKVGTTIMDNNTEDIDDPKNKYILFGMQNGKSPIIYRRHDYQIPFPNIYITDLEKVHTKNYLISKVRSVQKEATEILETNDFLTPLKHLYSLMKMYLVSRGIIVEGYSTVLNIFIKHTNFQFPTLPRIDKGIFDTDNDLLKIQKELIEWIELFLLLITK